MVLTSYMKEIIKEWEEKTGHLWYGEMNMTGKDNAIIVDHEFVKHLLMIVDKQKNIIDNIKKELIL